LYRSDHYESFPGPADRPTTDAWAVIAGLARDTTRIRLGALVSPVTYRLPGNLAKVVTTVDDMSDGRIDVAVGAGWHDEEHHRYGFPFPEIGDRATMLEEQLEILRGLWEGPDGWSFAGRFYSIADARPRPRPSRRMHVIVGGQASPRSLRIAARYADEFNLSGATPDQAAERYERLDEACRAIGRDPATMRRSVMAATFVGSDDAEVARRMAVFQTQVSGDAAADAAAAEEWFDDHRDRAVIGTPEQALAMVRRYAEAGAERIMLQDFIPWDLDMIDLLGREVVGRV
jgi:alkanesulfonate monooxygenase